MKWPDTRNHRKWCYMIRLDHWVLFVTVSTSHCPLRDIGTFQQTVVKVGYRNHVPQWWCWMAVGSLVSLGINCVARSYGNYSVGQSAILDNAICRVYNRIWHVMMWNVSLEIKFLIRFCLTVCISFIKAILCCFIILGACLQLSYKDKFTMVNVLLFIVFCHLPHSLLG